MGGYRYRLYLADGSDVGVFTTVGWGLEGRRPVLRRQASRVGEIVSIVPAEGDMFAGIFVVERRP